MAVACTPEAYSLVYFENYLIFSFLDLGELKNDVLTDFIEVMLVRFP